MKNQSLPRHLLHLLPLLLLLFLLSSCLSPITLNRAVVVYDEAVTSVESKQLLLNIARAQHHEPIHFTRVSNIAATFDFRFNAGATPALTGDASRTLMPIFGGSIAENPTFSIVPIGEEEFTKRLLTPFHQSKFTLLLRQHFDVDLLLRLMAQEVRIQHQEQQEQQASHRNFSNIDEKHFRPFRHGRQQATSRGDEQLIVSPNIRQTEEQQQRARLRSQRHKGQRIYQNSPSNRVGYEMFRRVVLHLSAIQDQNQLYAEPLTFEHSWSIPASSVSAEGFQSLEKEYTVQYNQENDTYTLSKQILGPVLITNYDPDILCCEESAELYDMTSPWIGNDVAFDIRSGYAGGEWPINGAFRLRSFHSILNFLGHALGEEPEYHVKKDPRTLPLSREKNPIRTMDLTVSDTSPPDANLSVSSHGQYYAVKTTGPYSHWNLNAFQLLYILFRMTVTDAPVFGVPSITIAK
jgi:hypothetical protein